ncbi:hypothetical protein Droror1_Dr00023906 [Drosera rotundifolia]
MHWISDSVKSLRFSDTASSAATTTGGNGGGNYISAGIRSDLAEFGGTLRSSLSLLSPKKAVSGLSNFAFSLLKSESNDDDVRVSEEVVELVEEMAARAELWTEFPMAIVDDDFEMSPSQAEHASLIEKLVPSLAALRISLRGDIGENLFWMIYFILLLPRLDEYNFKLLSTPRIVEARQTLLMMQKTKTAIACLDEHDLDESKTLRNPSQQESTSADIPEASREMEEKGRMSIMKRSEEAADVKARSSDTERQLPNPEDVSLSDLEVDGKHPSDTQSASGQRRISLRADSDEWVRLNEKSDTQDDCRSRHSELSSQGKDSEDEANEWLKIDEWITSK